MPKEAFLRNPADPNSGTITEETQVFIDVPVGSCEPHFMWPASIKEPKTLNSVAVKLRPPVSISVHAEIRAVAKVGRDTSRDVSYYRSDDDCDADYAVPASYCFSGGTSITGHSIGITTANCGSGFERDIELQGNCAFVFGRIHGCGYAGPSGTFCKGRGWLGYAGKLFGKFYDPTTLETWEGTQVASDQLAGTFEFQYPLEKLPGDIEDGSFRWLYTASVLLKEGDRVTTIRVNEQQPNAQGRVTSRMDLFDRSSGRLSVQVDAAVINALNR